MSKRDVIAALLADGWESIGRDQFVRAFNEHARIERSVTTGAYRAVIFRR